MHINVHAYTQHTRTNTHGHDPRKTHYPPLRTIVSSNATASALNTAIGRSTRVSAPVETLYTEALLITKPVAELLRIIRGQVRVTAASQCVRWRMVGLCNNVLFTPEKRDEAASARGSTPIRAGCRLAAPHRRHRHHGRDTL